MCYQVWLRSILFLGKYSIGYVFIVTLDACDPWCTMCFKEKLVMGNLTKYVNVINVFHDKNSTLYLVISIHHKAEFLIQVINVFSNCKINLIHEKKQKLGRNLDTRWKITENSRAKTSLF